MPAGALKNAAANILRLLRRYFGEKIAFPGVFGIIEPKEKNRQPVSATKKGGEADTERQNLNCEGEYR